MQVQNEFFFVAMNEYTIFRSGALGQWMEFDSAKIDGKPTISGLKKFAQSITILFAHKRANWVKFGMVLQSERDIIENYVLIVKS